MADMPTVAKLVEEPLFTLTLEGFEPITDLRAGSTWNGLWELRKGPAKIIMASPSSGITGAIKITDGDKLRSHTVVGIAPSLLVPVKA